MLFGARGKGAVIAMQLITRGLTFDCLDSDPRKNRLYTKATGVRVELSSYKNLLRYDSVRLVANCKHEEFTRTIFKENL